MRVSHVARGARRRRDAQSGETLIELLATIGLLSTAIIGLLVAMATLMLTTDSYNRVTRANIAVYEFAESLKVGADDPNTEYSPCALPSTYATITASPSRLPAGWTAEVVSVRYWNGTTDANNRLVWTTVCNTPANDKGLQEIRIRVRSPLGRPHVVDEEVVIVKRNNACPAAYSNDGDNKPC